MPEVTRFVRSAQLIWQGRAPKKMSRWLELCRLSAGRRERILGFDVEYFSQHSFAHLFHEVFAREGYLFDSDTDEPVIFDCGANIGMATLFFQWLYPNSTVIAFEPDPATFQLLCRNIERNRLKAVQAHNVALWDQDCEVCFYVNNDEPGSLLMSTNPSRMRGKQITVPAKKLSEYVNVPVDLLKLDIEGAESRVVAELVESGKIDMIRRLIIEYHHNISCEPSGLGAFLGMLESCGWRYQMNAWFFPVVQQNTFQDIRIYGYK